MKQSSPENSTAPEPAIPAVPLTTEGFAVLHQMFRVARSPLRALGSSERQRIVSQAVAMLEQMARREDGESAIFSQLGHKGDLMVLHFRRTFDELNRAEVALANLELSDYLEPTTSYLSVIELGVYEASVAFYRDLLAKGMKPHSDEWTAAVAAELDRQRAKMATRLYPKIPRARYLCFYPMDKKREGADNWYRLPIEHRRDLMREHGMVGRRYAGEVTQIISGSIGFDDWEWGVDLFAEDPLVFKKLVYEMRFDEASAGYGKFGAFYFAIRLEPSDLGQNLIG
ncbi:MAG TPA: hydrogen peroxide-dependent heme synthase [Candidatus Binataceae bacterium]|nr:hydrogen peroxide-dependent heme synthase [Candidatus Binataceae bacterium]